METKGTADLVVCYELLEFGRVEVEVAVEPGGEELGVDVDERLLDVLRQTFPPLHRLLRSKVRRDGVDVEIINESIDRHRQGRVLHRREGEAGGVIHHHARGGAELLLDRAK